MKEIEDFLRENKPQVKKDPTFILETRRRLEQVEGIKSEVDRQRHHGRVALIVALCAGLTIGHRRHSAEHQALPAKLPAVSADAHCAPCYFAGGSAFQKARSDIGSFRNIA